VNALTDEQLAGMLSDAAKVKDRLFCADQTHRLLGGHVKALAGEVERLKAEIAGAVDALNKPGRDAYAVAGSLEDGINTDHLHCAAERGGLFVETEIQAELLDRVKAQLARWRHIRNRQDAAAEMQAELDREVVS
jgi:hypothetical protein